RRGYNRVSHGGIKGVGTPLYRRTDAGGSLKGYELPNDESLRSENLPNRLGRVSRIVEWIS
ncbi:MAG: hypothetical protein ACTSWV_03175, partial [Candidatus Asgardarchaeia archaeon]